MIPIPICAQIIAVVAVAIASKEALSKDED